MGEACRSTTPSRSPLTTPSRTTIVKGHSRTLAQPELFDLALLSTPASIGADAGMFRPFASFAAIRELVCFKHEIGHITLIEALREEGGA
jgi:hypothetical protein